MEVFITRNSRATQKIALDFARQILKSAPRKRAIVLGLVGDLGSGKTIFAKGFAKGLGIKKVITSPTFVLEKIYKLSNKNYEHLVHIDAYRVENPKEISDLGFKSLVSHPQNIILIEWADRIKNILPRDCIKINFEHIKKDERKILINSKLKTLNIKL